MSSLNVQRAVRIVRVTALAVAPNAAVVLQPKLNLGGHRRVRGMIEQTVNTLAGAGFPRVRQSADGITWQLVTVLPLDPGQATTVYPFDVAVQLPYVAIEYENGGAQADVRATAWALPE